MLIAHLQHYNKTSSKGKDCFLELIFDYKYSELNSVVFLELRRWINLFSTLRTLRLCVNLKTKSRKDAKDRKE